MTGATRPPSTPWYIWGSIWEHAGCRKKQERPDARPAESPVLGNAGHVGCFRRSSMSDSRRGMLWRLFHASPRAKIALFIFAVQIIAFTSIFHYAYPILEDKPVSWPNALLFVLETVTTVGYGDLLP